MTARLLVTLALLALAGCSSAPRASRAPLSERQRDSVLARSSLAGAGAVGPALSMSDDQARRAQGMNAAVDSLFH